MVKKLCTVVCALAVVCLLSSSSWAQDRAKIGGKWGIGGRYGYVDTDHSPSVKHQGSLEISYHFVDYIGLALEAAIMSDEITYYSGFLDLLLRLPIQDWAVYARGGVGMQNRNFSGMGDYNDSFSKRVGGGLEYFFTEWLAANAEALYVWGGDNSFESPQYRAGLTLYF